jgi:hypothetical protein
MFILCLYFSTFIAFYLDKSSLKLIFYIIITIFDRLCIFDSQKN